MSLHAPTVLLVEDDPNDARLVQRAFSRGAAEVSVLRLQNGDEAVSYLRGDPPYDNRHAHPMPAIVLLDIKLPRRSGFEVLQWVRTQTDFLRRLPVVMLTSSTHSADVNRAYDLGVNSYVAKPESTEQLNELVQLFSSYWLAI
ncbi:MAG TPA: response regulator, partial [Terriglobales bacterium]|nr:response regulator [Terriglobales bacterium]